MCQKMKSLAVTVVTFSSVIWKSGIASLVVSTEIIVAPSVVLLNERFE